MESKILVQKLIEYVLSLADDEKILSERQLCIQFKCSRNTLREALIHLKIMGLVYSKQGKGYFKEKNFQNEEITQVYKEKISRKVQVFQSIKVKNFVENNFVTCINIERCKYFNDVAIEHQQIFINKHLFKDLTNLNTQLPILDILKNYQFSNTIKIEEVTKVIKHKNKTILNTNFDHVVFSRYNYYNENNELLIVLESQYVLDKYYFKNIKTMLIK